jgi:hypothetical protein
VDSELALLGSGDPERLRVSEFYISLPGGKRFIEGPTGG